MEMTKEMWDNCLAECEKLNCRWLCQTSDGERYCSAFMCTENNSVMKHFREEAEKEWEAQDRKNNPLKYFDSTSKESVQDCIDFYHREIKKHNDAIKDCQYEIDTLESIMRGFELPF